MAKKKLSRDQKRKQKKEKRKQRKKQPPYLGKSKRVPPKIEILPPDIQMSEDEDPQFARIMQIFGTTEIPSVDADNLQTYFNYLKDNLEVPCLLTGIESIGYFGWEERFEFGYGSKAEYQRLQKERGSYHDQYELKEFEVEIEPGWDMWVEVRRTSDGERFTIPLSELEAVDETSENYILLNDYTVWIVNWR